MKWYWVRFTDRQRGHDVIGHTVSEELMDPVIQDLVVRGYIPESVAEAAEVVLDQPGFYIMGTPVETFEIDDLKIIVPTCHVDAIANSVKEASLRDDTWYKMHGWRNCLCLNVYQRLSLLNKILNRANKANDKYDRFLDAWSKKNQRLANV